MKRLALPVLLGAALATGLACSIGPQGSCGTFVAACSPLPPTSTGPAEGAWPTGGSFLVTETIEGGRPLDLADGLRASIEFGQPGHLEVHTGCNVVQVAGELADDRIVSVTAMIPSPLPCPSRPSDLGQWVTALFEAAPTWSVDADRLTVATDQATLIGRRTSASG